ncbi:hypothetical protein PybrP1_012287 [[Pythium] brassicae (nom. inval.)]|nr:hypothetical protein PybrP1_012287 [[Pythium] brassicae (nom. inval.)]
MTPEEIQGDYRCAVTVEDYRVGKKKAEFKVVVALTFYSARTHSSGATSWHIWRSFSAFRKLDEQLRQRNAAHLKGIKFPPLHRRRALFRTHLRADFLDARMRELDNYMSVVVRSPALVAFHVASVQSQTLKTFVGFANGFGSNPYYEQPDAALRPSVSVLATATPAAMRATESVLGDDDDDFRSVSSSSTISSVASSSSAADYRWSGTGFVGSSSYVRHTAPMGQSFGHNNSFQNTSSSFGSSSSSSTPNSSFGPAGSRASVQSGRGSWFPVSSNGAAAATTSTTTMALVDGGMRPSIGVSRGSMMAVTPSDVITPELDLQRARMEEELLKLDLMGVGMPPDGSCLLHCVVYEMFPLQCLREYPASMAVVNVGAADGVAPRRVAAAQFLRVKLMDYALAHVATLAAFLLQDEEDLRERYEVFRDTSDEQATTAELYAAASMFNLEIVLISNDESFVIDPVLPVAGLPAVREGPLRTVTFGYLVPADGLAGHYICTRERRAPFGAAQNSFAGGSYRGSVSIGPPPKSARCSTAGARRFERIPEQRVE